MVNHQTQFGATLRDPFDALQVARVHKQVIRDIVASEDAQAIQHARLYQPIVHRLALDQMPHALEFRMRGQFIQLLLNPITHQINPADDACDKRMSVSQT